MGSNKVELFGKDSGSIWTKKPVPDGKDGLAFELSNTKPGLTSQGKHLLFSRVAFGIHGNWFVAGDHLGNLYHFDLTKNRFKLVARCGHACTALSCSISRPSEVLLALSDYTIRCIDVETCEMIASLSGHDASVSSISLHSSGRLALAVSSRDCVLWDLETFERHKTLNGGQEVGVQDVFFVPLTNVILSCFKDDSIHAWDVNTLDYKYQIPPPFGPAPHYRAFAVPQDGQLLVAGGRTNYLHVWTLENRQMLRIIQLPSKVRVVKQLLFVPSSFDGGSSECLGFLAQDGIMRFINVHSCKQMFQIGSPDQRLSGVQVCPMGKTLTGVSEAGNLLVYDVDALSSALLQPPAPVVRMQADSSISSDVKPSKVQPPARGRVRRAPRQDKVTLLDRRKKQEGLDDQVPGRCGLDADKLDSILTGFGEYPAKYRMFIWRTLLQLPENHASYSSLLERGTHPAYLTLHQRCPLKSRKLLRVLQRSLSALAHWTPIFGETDYLPGLAFPFVKMFQNNQLVTFELLGTILLNWCGEWFEYFPNPPFNILAMVENCLARHDPTLLEHFITYDITSQMYAWTLLSTLFSEVLLKGEWLRVWDNVLSRPPGYLLLMVVAYLTVSRTALFRCSNKKDFEYFFCNHNSVDVSAVIHEANLMRKTTPDSINPEKLLPPFQPLTKGTYPIFSKYPKFIVDYQVQEREQIRLEELEYLRERQGALELERMLEQRKEEEEAWYRQQKLLVEAEEQRRTMMEAEEAKLTDQRTRLQALKRELRVKELHVLDAARRKFLAHQQGTKETELKRMDRQIHKKARLRERETQAVMDDIQTRTVELERQKALLEQELARCQEEMRYRLHAETESQKHSSDLDKRMFERVLEEEMAREKGVLDEAQVELARLQAAQAAEATVAEALARKNLRDLKQTLDMEQAIEKAKLNQLEEKKLQLLMSEIREAEAAVAGRDTAVDTMRTSGDDTAVGTMRTSGDDTTGTSVGGLNLGSASPSTSNSTDSSGGNAGQDATQGSTLTSDEPSTIGNSALQWSRRRDLLDQQEKAMMTRVRELRKKVAGRMSNDANRSSYGPMSRSGRSLDSSATTGTVMTPDSSLLTPGTTATPLSTATPQTTMMTGTNNSSRMTSGGTSFWSPLKSH